jgi:hypothetical protein
MSNPLNDLIRDTIANHPRWDPYKIAATVAELVAPEDLPAFFLATLEPYVVSRMGQARNYSLNSPKSHSPKLAERRTWWERVKREKVFVGDYQWKAVRNCTLDDLRFVIEQRQQMIGALQGQILKYETIAAAMEEHGADTVDDLPLGAVEFA